MRPLARERAAEKSTDASPAKLYATLVGGVLVIAGIVGFFYSASFGGPGEVDDVLGLFGVNGWHNLVHILTGALGLLLAGFAARRYAFWLGIVYLGIALWGFVIGSGDVDPRLHPGQHRGQLPAPGARAARGGGGAGDTEGAARAAHRRSGR